MISMGAVILLATVACVGLLLWIGMPYTRYRCRCGLVDLTGRDRYEHPSCTHTRRVCR